MAPFFSAWTAPSHAPLLGLGRADSGQMRTPVSVVDALGHDDGQNNVDGTLMRVDAERGDVGFEMSSEFDSLWSGGSCWLHTSKHRYFPFLSRDRLEGGLSDVWDDKKNEVVSY